MPNILISLERRSERWGEIQRGHFLSHWPNAHRAPDIRRIHMESRTQRPSLQGDKVRCQKQWEHKAIYLQLPPSSICQMSDQKSKCEVRKVSHYCAVYMCSLSPGPRWGSFALWLTLGTLVSGCMGSNLCFTTYSCMISGKLLNFSLF